MKVTIHLKQPAGKILQAEMTKAQVEELISAIGDEQCATIGIGNSPKVFLPKENIAFIEQRD